MEVGGGPIAQEQAVLVGHDPSGWTAACDGDLGRVGE